MKLEFNEFKKEREALMTIQKMSETTGISKKTIARIETGEYNPSISTAQKYLNAIGYEIKVGKMG